MEQLRFFTLVAVEHLRGYLPHLLCAEWLWGRQSSIFFIFLIFSHLQFLFFFIFLRISRLCFLLIFHWISFLLVLLYFFNAICVQTFDLRLFLAFLSDFWVLGGSWIHLEKENGSKRLISRRAIYLFL